MSTIRERDASADDCGECRYRSGFSWHVPAEECKNCACPSDHHAYVRGEPDDEAAADRRTLIRVGDALAEAAKAINGDPLDWTKEGWDALDAALAAWKEATDK